MTSKITPFAFAKRLRPLARRYGARLLYVLEVEPCFWSPFSTSLGLDRSTRRVFFTNNAQVTGMIHELGHVFFDPQFGPMGDEYAWFAWEYEVAKTFGVDELWREDNYSYGVDDKGTSFGNLSREEQNEILKEQTHVARLHKYLEVLP
jgi:hypothetical protein